MSGFMPWPLRGSLLPYHECTPLISRCRHPAMGCAIWHCPVLTLHAGASASPPLIHPIETLHLSADSKDAYLELRTEGHAQKLRLCFCAAEQPLLATAISSPLRLQLHRGPITSNAEGVCMRTIVIQSYRTTDTPAWLLQCMLTVKAWTESNGYEYEFIDDGLFDYVPRRFRTPAPQSLLPLTDLARLGILREKLASGHERALWIDADVVIFRPDEFRIPDRCGALLCQEIWIHKDAQGQIHHERGINNAVMVFDRGHPLLGFLHYAAMELFTYLEPAKIRTTTIGTDFLTKLGRLYPMRLMTDVACLSPLLVHALSTGQQPDLLQQHAEHFGPPFHAANLCRSKLEPKESSTGSHQHRLSAGQLADVVERLIASHGETLSPLHQK